MALVKLIDAATVAVLEPAATVFTPTVNDEQKLWYVEPSTCAIYPPDEPLTWLVMP